MLFLFGNHCASIKSTRAVGIVELLQDPVVGDGPPLARVDLAVVAVGQDDQDAHVTVVQPPGKPGDGLVHLLVVLVALYLNLVWAK